MIVNVPSLAVEPALALVRAVLDAAAQADLRVAVAVVDPQGSPVALARMDGVTPPILTFAQDKAFTAATMRRSTAAFADRMLSNPSLSLGLGTRTGLLPWGGGVPVIHAGTVVGGIGVSGATDQQDIALAETALAQVGLAG